MAAADLVKTVQGSALKAKGFALEKWRDFREESPYFQAKFALVGAWLVISVLTIAIVPPDTIPFVVEQQTYSFGLGTRTSLNILNVDGGDLDEAVVEVTGTLTDFDGKKTAGMWRTKQLIIAEGPKTTLGMDQFTNDKGEIPNAQVQIDLVRILDDGDEVFVGPPTAPLKKR